MLTKTEQSREVQILNHTHIRSYRKSLFNEFDCDRHGFGSAGRMFFSVNQSFCIDLCT